MSERRKRTGEWRQSRAFLHSDRDAEVVEGSTLSAALRRWVVAWLAERNPDDDRGRSFLETGGVHVYGPIDLLAEKTGMTTKYVASAINGDLSYIGIQRADALLTAANLHHLLGTEVAVMPNPWWSLERWVTHMAERGCT